MNAVLRLVIICSVLLVAPLVWKQTAAQDLELEEMRRSDPIGTGALAILYFFSHFQRALCERTTPESLTEYDAEVRLFRQRFPEAFAKLDASEYLTISNRNLEKDLDAYRKMVPDTNKIRVVCASAAAELRRISISYGPYLNFWLRAGDRIITREEFERWRKEQTIKPSNSTAEGEAGKDGARASP